jgi:DNA-binding transcriptional MerR regulator
MAPEAGEGEPIPEESSSRPVYSIGAVAKMLGVDPATLRSWEDRYGLVVPARTEGSQRVYSRDELARLQFVVNQLQGSASAADAHRLLAQQMGVPSGVASLGDTPTVVVVLLAERDRYAAELFEFFLRTEGYDVCLALDPDTAEQLYVERHPNLSIVELMIPGGGLAVCARLARDASVPVLAVSALALRDEALEAGASAFLDKPFEPLQFISTVRDLLGDSALTRQGRVPVG